MKIEQQAALLGLSFKDGSYQGYVEGYRYQLVETKIMFQTAGSLVFIFNKEIPRQAYSELSKVCGFFKRPSLLSLIKEKNGFGVLFVEKSQEKATDFVAKIIEVIKKYGLTTLDEDVFETGEADGFKLIKHRLGITDYVLQNISVPVHLAAFEAHYQDQLKAIETDANDQTNKTKAILFALVGALVGACIPFTIYFLGYFSAWAFAAVPALSFYMYKQAKGPKNNAVIAIICLFSLIASFLAILANWYIITEDLGVDFSLLFTDPNVSPTIYGELGMTLLFYALGVFISWRYIYSGTAAQRKNDLDSIK